MGRSDFIQTLVDFLELLPPTTVVERISGEAPPDYFIGPSWCLDKPAVRNAFLTELERRDTWQGKLFETQKREARGSAREVRRAFQPEPSAWKG